MIQQRRRQSAVVDIEAVAGDILKAVGKCVRGVVRMTRQGVDVETVDREGGESQSSTDDWRLQKIG